MPCTTLTCGPREAPRPVNCGCGEVPGDVRERATVPRPRWPIGAVFRARRSARLEACPAARRCGYQADAAHRRGSVVNANRDGRLARLEASTAPPDPACIVLVSADVGDKEAIVLTMNSAPVPDDARAELEREGYTVRGAP